MSIIDFISKLKYKDRYFIVSVCFSKLLVFLQRLEKTVCGPYDLLTHRSRLQQEAVKRVVAWNTHLPDFYTTFLYWLDIWPHCNTDPFPLLCQLS